MDLRIDLLVEHALRRKPPRPVLRTFRVLTELGGGWFVTIATTLLVGGLLFKRRRREAIYVYSNVALGSLARWLVHFAVARPRPSKPHIHVTGAAFPSGHTTAAALLYGTCARLRGGVMPWIGAGMLVAGVGASRIVLRAHWLTDVLAGVGFAAAWMTAVDALLGPRPEGLLSQPQAP